MIISKSEIDSLLSARNSNPHSYLGLHPCEVDGKSGLVARAFVRDAVTCEVVRIQKTAEKRYPLEQLDDAGFFEGFISSLKKPFKYRLRVTYANGEELKASDYAEIEAIVDISTDHDYRIIETIAAVIDSPLFR